MVSAPSNTVSQTSFTPERISQSATIALEADIAIVFSLFGPILEKKWAHGWEPEIIYSTSRLVEEYMIFRTRAPHPSEDYFTWVVTQYEPEKYLIEYTVSTLHRIWFIRVECSQRGPMTL